MYPKIPKTPEAMIRPKPECHSFLIDLAVFISGRGRKYEDLSALFFTKNENNQKQNEIEDHPTFHSYRNQFQAGS